MARRQFISFPFCDLSIIKKQVLNWSVRFNTCSFLDNHDYPSQAKGYECIAAVGERSRLQTTAGDAFLQLKQFSDQAEDWLFGHFSFDLKKETEGSPSNLPDHIGFPDLFFYVPEIIVLFGLHAIEIGLFGSHHKNVMEDILSTPLEISAGAHKTDSIRSRISKQEYIETIEQLHRHILRGDCYEINFCQEFFTEGAEINPVQLFQDLSHLSPSPFSAFYKTDDRFLLCASPERYLKKENDLIFSQPIKGTAARDTADSIHDQELKTALAESEKDRTENVMIVDLVRNDLSKICETDSVHVSELFGIYSFPLVHQMISTIAGKPLFGMHWTEMIGKTFPMGSMTGAPKKRVLELIEKYEKTKRGLFSGALGYVKPDQDFDFNVVIRSILYNRETQYLSYFAGSGITINSDPDLEYEECLAKVAAFENIIKNPSREMRDGFRKNNLSK